MRSTAILACTVAWLLITLLAAVLVGWAYGGKSWC